MSIFLQICVAVFCLSTVGLHIAKRNMTETKLYGLQSLAVAALLGVSWWNHHSWMTLMVVLITLIVKVVLAPVFFTRLIKRHSLKFTDSTRANVPEIIGGIVLILLLVSSHFFAPLTNIDPQNHTYLVLTLSMLFVSIMLMTNRRGTLSQAVGILSLENSIVAFAFFAGLEQSPALEIGIIFDVFVWLMVASIFVSMAYRHFGSTDVKTMRNLKG